MDLTDRRNPFINLAFPPPPPPPPSTAFIIPIFPRTSSSGTNFPIIAVAVIGILVTAFLLISYYVFVIKCCLNWHHLDIFRSRRNSDQNPLMVYTPRDLNRGLDEGAIRAIPFFKFKKRDVVAGEEDQNKSSQECSVCLNEFQEDEKLRIIPNCCHVFHIDCIDIWLQGNANCPLCRTSVSCDASYPLDLISAPCSPPVNNSPRARIVEPGAVLGSDNNFVGIELGTSNGNNRQSVRNRDFLARQESNSSDDVMTGNTSESTSPPHRMFDHSVMHKRGRRFHKMTSMGDECIDTRGELDDQFREIQPIRRSISMDSSADRQLYLAVQEAISHKNRQNPMAGDGGDCTEDRSSSSSGGNNRVIKRCFFSFGSSSRVSRSSSILPVYSEP